MTRRHLPASPPAALALALVFVLGGLVAPGLHRAQHARAWAAERAAHVAAHHHAPAGTADVPCAPAARDLDCALCSGLAAFALATAPAGRVTETTPSLVSTETTAHGVDVHISSRPRAPPDGAGRVVLG